MRKCRRKMNQPVSDGKRRVFTEEERLLLRSLVSAHEGLLKAQNANGSSTKERRRQWEKIAASFNNSSEVVTPRSAPELRKAWENMKYRAKHAHDRQYRMVRDSTPPLPPPVDPDGDSPLALLPSQCLETIIFHENQDHHVKTDPDSPIMGMYVPRAPKSHWLHHESSFYKQESPDNEEEQEEYHNHEDIPEPIASAPITIVSTTSVTPPTRTVSPTSSFSPENGHIHVKRGRPHKRDKYDTVCDHDVVLIKKQRELVDLQLEVYNLKKMIAFNKLQHMQKAYEVDLKHKEEEHNLKMRLLRRGMEK